MGADFRQRFAQLSARADELLANQKPNQVLGSGETYVDADGLISWQVNTRHLLSVVCGEQSEHVRAFDRHEKPRYVGESKNDILMRQRAVLAAAKDDYDGGYLAKLRGLIQADMFASELEQAEELFRAGYPSAAAVIAGVVLETTLRQMCEDHKIHVGKLDKMNADLAKVPAYNSLDQKRITALAAIRNSAAHGRSEDFSDEAVAAMIRDVQDFVTRHTS